MKDNISIRLTGVEFSHEEGGEVLSGLDLSLRAGQRLGITGHIGSGKTTLLHVIMGLLRIGAGTIEIFGKHMSEEKDFAAVRGRVGLLFQDPDDQLFCPTVLEDVAFGPLNQGIPRQEAIAISVATLASVGLEGFEDRITHHLSGGEKKLVSLATVLAMRPQVLLLDEPLTGLDPDSSARVVSILASLDQGMIVVSHDRRLLETLTGSILTISGGRLEPGA
ncbi:MAG TPA: ABC transporter ATP-binding protein [Candidatus Krumholzibacterium sp.]|nr:ABC transporter ATP-binding protein [Candidatus Krumholzibacterium sp.]